jgi:polysaccharide export outer membrane protein
MTKTLAFVSVVIFLSAVPSTAQKKASAPRAPATQTSQPPAIQTPPPTVVPSPAAEQGPRGDAPVRTSYALGPDDQLIIRVADVPDITDKPQRIDPNGDLRLPLVGKVHAAGMTVEALERELTERLKVYLQEPDVSIQLTEFRSQPVSVIGAVGTSGVRQLEGRKSLIEIISLAGGLTADAGPVLRITRRLDVGTIPLPEASVDTANGFSSVEIRVKPLLDGLTPEKNITVQPYDVISVPKADVVYVVGEVTKPGMVQLNAGQSVSILEALASAGGVLRTSDPKKARVLRREPGQDARVDLSVDVQKITQGTAADIRLTAGDILVIPDNTGRRVAVRAIEAAIQMGTIYATWGVIH